MELSLFNQDLTEVQREAVELHYEIRKNGEIVASAMVEFCKGLKKMRDRRLYEELQFSSFEEYVEKAVGLKQRQAYNYIQVLESYGETDLHSNARLGVTKLKILADISKAEREEFCEQNDVEEMSTRELKDAVDKLAKANEQITFLSEELNAKSEALSEAEKDAVQADEEKETLEAFYKEKLQAKDNELIELKKSLKEAESKPVEVSVREPNEDEIKKLTSKAVNEAKKQAKAEKEKAVADAEAKAKKQLEEMEAKYKEVISSAEKEKAESASKLAELEKNSKVSQNPEVLKFSFYFKEVQKYINEMKAILKTVDAETADKLKAAMDAVAGDLAE